MDRYHVTSLLERKSEWLNVESVKMDSHFIISSQRLKRLNSYTEVESYHVSDKK